MRSPAARNPSRDSATDVGFAAVESILRAIGEPSAAERVVLDLARVTRLDPAVAPLLADLAIGLAGPDECGLAWSDEGANGATLDAIDGLLEAMRSGLPMRFTELDAAVEWCEERTLARHAASASDAITLARHPVLAGLSPDGFAVLFFIVEDILAPKCFARLPVPARKIINPSRRN